MNRKNKQQKSSAKEKPTLITEKPCLARVAGHRNKVKVCLCDDGQLYTLSALAELIGVAYPSLIQRLRIYGWGSPLVLMPKSSPGLSIDGKPMRNNNGGNGNAAWRALSNTARNRKSGRI